MPAALFAAIYHNNDLEQVKALLKDNPALIHSKASNCNKETPLHLAARRRCGDIVQFLLANKANVEARSSEGRTPLHLAAMFSDANGRIIELLLANKADINSEDVVRKTPLYYADSRMGKLLKQRGAKEKASDYASQQATARLLQSVIDNLDRK